ncbi:MAG: hypothetical protein ACRDSN_21085, partial [Pseudonocardiaceae bacterium]
HDDCALRNAKEVLEVDQSTARNRDSLVVVQYGITDHAGEGCPCPADCYAVRTAREVLGGNPAAAEINAGSCQDGNPLTWDVP